MDTDLAKGCFGLVFICVHLRPSVVRLGGTVDENRSGVPLALPVLLRVVWIFVDERHSLEKGSAFRHAPVSICQRSASLISNGFTRLVCDLTQSSTGRASGTQSLIPQTFNLPVPPRRIPEHAPPPLSSTA